MTQIGQKDMADRKPLKEHLYKTFVHISAVTWQLMPFFNPPYYKSMETLRCHINQTKEPIFIKLENVLINHYAPNHMPDPKGEWSLKENNSELHHGICSKVNQFIYTLVCNFMPNIRILAKAVLKIFYSQGCSYTNEKGE